MICTSEGGRDENMGTDFRNCSSDFEQPRASVISLVGCVDVVQFSLSLGRLRSQERAEQELSFGTGCDP